jgi:predicted metal-binding membrane protein
VSWTAAGLAAYAIYKLGAELTGDTFAWDNAGPYLAGAIIIAAAVYQLTPLKDVCLRHCRSPLFFLLGHSRPGRVGALRMGIEHGGYCVGCCWMLMAALFALGVMSIGWMAFVAALIATEKLLPWKAVANRGIAILLLALGLGVMFSAQDIPGLTLPDSAEAHRAMESMGMDSGSGGMQSEGMKESSGMNDSGAKGESGMNDSMP